MRHSAYVNKKEMILGFSIGMAPILPTSHHILGCYIWFYEEKFLILNDYMRYAYNFYDP